MMSEPFTQQFNPGNFDGDPAKQRDPVYSNKEDFQKKHWHEKEWQDDFDEENVLTPEKGIDWNELLGPENRARLATLYKEHRPKADFQNKGTPESLLFGFSEKGQQPILPKILVEDYVKNLEKSFNEKLDDEYYNTAISLMRKGEEDWDAAEWDKLNKEEKSVRVEKRLDNIEARFLSESLFLSEEHARFKQDDNAYKAYLTSSLREWKNVKENSAYSNTEIKEAEVNIKRLTKLKEEFQEMPTTNRLSNDEAKEIKTRLYTIDTDYLASSIELEHKLINFRLGQIANELGITEEDLNKIIQEPKTKELQLIKDLLEIDYKLDVLLNTEPLEDIISVLVKEFIDLQEKHSSLYSDVLYDRFIKHEKETLMLNPTDINYSFDPKEGVAGIFNINNCKDPNKPRYIDFISLDLTKQFLEAHYTSEEIKEDLVNDLTSSILKQYCINNKESLQQRLETLIDQIIEQITTTQKEEKESEEPPKKEEPKQPEAPIEKTKDETEKPLFYLPNISSRFDNETRLFKIDYYEGAEIPAEDDSREPKDAGKPIHIGEISVNRIHQWLKEEHTKEEIIEHFRDFLISSIEDKYCINKDDVREVLTSMISGIVDEAQEIRPKQSQTSSEKKPTLPKQTLHPTKKNKKDEPFTESLKETSPEEPKEHIAKPLSRIALDVDTYEMKIRKNEAIDPQDIMNSLNDVSDIIERYNKDDYALSDNSKIFFDRLNSKIKRLRELFEKIKDGDEIGPELINEQDFELVYLPMVFSVDDVETDKLNLLEVAEGNETLTKLLQFTHYVLPEVIRKSMLEKGFNEIKPVNNEMFNPEYHEEFDQVVITQNKDNHNHIKTLHRSGLEYKGTTIVKAKVTTLYYPH